MADPHRRHTKLLGYTILGQPQLIKDLFEVDTGMYWSNAGLSHRSSSMVIYDLHSFCMPISPQETNSPLVVDTDTMFSLAITLQRLKPVRWWKPKILQPHGCVNRIEPHERSLLNLPWELPHELAIENSLSIRVAERFNHAK
jgi:hypothetical protein